MSSQLRSSARRGGPPSGRSQQGQGCGRGCGGCGVVAVVVHNHHDNQQPSSEATVPSFQAAPLTAQ
jgi:hypothetical protein